MTTPASPSDPEPRLIELPTGPVAITDEGRGPVVLAIHGLPGSVRDVRWLAPPLVAAGLRVIRVDMPGFGGSPWSTARTGRMGPRAGVVADLLSALDLHDVTVVGHSFGGVVGAELAVRDPRVVRLAMVASWGVRTHRGLLQFPRPGLISALLRNPATRWLLLPRLRTAFARAGFSSALPDSDLMNCVHCLAGASIARHADNVRRLTVPTLVAWAADDALVEADIAEELGDSAPDGPRLGFEDGGHNIQKSQAVELGAAISLWVLEG